MAVAGFKTTTFKKGIQEERKFTEPVVRFRRVRGRIIPIFNRKRSGQLVNRGSNTALGAGSLLVAAGLARRAAKKSGLFSGFSLTANSPLRTLGRGTPKSRALKIAKASTKVLTKPLSFALKNPLLAGASVIGAGIIGRQVGFELEARSRFGFDVGAKE